MNYTNQQGPQTIKTSSNTGKVESALDTLSGRVHHISKLAEELIDLIQYPQQIPCALGGVDAKSEPTLSQKINRIDSRVDDTAQRLALVIDIIRQNLGSIKLD